MARGLTQKRRPIMRPASMRRKPKYLTAPRIAEICGCDLKTIHNWVNRGALDGFRTPGRHLRFTSEAVVSFLQEFGYAVPEWLCAQKQT